VGDAKYIQERRAICLACSDRDGTVCHRCDKTCEEIIADSNSSCPIGRFKTLRTQIQEQFSEDVPYDEIEKKLAICRQCSYSTTGPLEDCDIESGNPALATILKTIGNWMVEKGLGGMRCKKCGCFCGAKARYGSLIQIVTGGLVDGRCPAVGSDGLNNWDRGYCI